MTSIRLQAEIAKTLTLSKAFTENRFVEGSKSRESSPKTSPIFNFLNSVFDFSTIADPF